MQQPLPPSILYESPTKSIVLIDIPASLSAPHGLVPRCLHQPLTTPYAITEPKVQTAFSQELSHTHNLLRDSLLRALEDVQQHHRSPYCRPRVPPGQDDNESGQELNFYANIPFLQFSNPAEEPIVLDNDMILSDISDILLLPVISPSNNWTTLTLSHPHPPKIFHIPPNSSFLLASFQSSITAFKTLSEQVGRFHFILLDPPWPNRSAVRSSVYSTFSRFSMKDLLRLPLGGALVQPRNGGGGDGCGCDEDSGSGSKEGEYQDGGLVGVWITNKPKFRAYVLETLFPSWGVEPVGAWTWLKVTTAGQPIFDLESRIRKPYEILLFGRKTPGPIGNRQKKKHKANGSEGQTADLLGNRSNRVTTTPTVPEKVILAVPDLHSRKPCIKGLIEAYLPPSYRACEIFGRNLTGGWFTWGDEALKFNWDGHWKEEEDEDVDHK